MSDKIHNKKILKPIRKKLRHNLTDEEAVLWYYLKKNKLENRKFRRQHSVGNYLLDFYCPSEKLAIELDGSGHYTDSGLEKDKIRNNYLNKLNIKVLRISNVEVNNNIQGVLQYIIGNFTTPVSPPKIGGEKTK
ncbi:MAG: endonuclease domain-containing protein [FCB group bacterium]|jgi:very-short-patch-repair endonuclease